VVGSLRDAGLRLLPALVSSAVLLFALPAAAHAGGIKFAVAQDYPSSTGTYNGTASPGAVAHLYRDEHADRKADLVIANTGGGPVVLYGVGDGRFSTQRKIIDNSDTDASAVEVADFNADGIPDIVSGGYTTLRITVMLGRRDGTFHVSGQYPLQGVWPSQFQIADLNGDGDLDIATSAYEGGEITILLGNGDGTFREAPPVPASSVALAMLVADLDDDAIPDMAVAESVPTNAPGGSQARGGVHTLLGNGDGSFRPLASYPVGVSPEVIQYGDIDEDGEKDLALTNTFITNDASILSGLGGGRFAPEQRLRLGGPSSGGVLDVRAAEFVEGLKLVDFDGDGHLDMAVTQIVSSRLLIFQGDGRGHFTPAGSYDVTGFPEDVMVGDLDGDGCQDLAVPGNVPPVGPSDAGVTRVSVLLNLSAGCGQRPPADPALQCGERPLVLKDARIRGGRVKLVGVAEPKFAGRTVRFNLRRGGRIVARTKTRPDGTFSAAAPLPAKKLRDRARYQAKIGRRRSNALKLRRRITVRPLTLKHDKLRIRGRVSPPFTNPRASITLTRRVSCRYRIVKRFKPRDDGTFVVAAKAPKGGAGAVYRLKTRGKKVPARSLPLYYAGT
jgi:hypothetical protein